MNPRMQRKASIDCKKKYKKNIIIKNEKKEKKSILLKSSVIVHYFIKTMTFFKLINYILKPRKSEKR